MKAEDYERVNDIFLRACDLSEPERSAFLLRACGNDTGLRVEVEAMLMHDAGDCRAIEFAVDGGLGHLLAKNIGTASPDPIELPRYFGDYELIRKIGEGGMGTVYEARQEHPRRTVAIKVIRYDAMSGEMIDRFRREANLLARLHHPGIANIYGAGFGDTNLPNGQVIKQPFFAMELIHGQSLGNYIKKRRLSTRETLVLLTKICDAVQHAHERGVIHRDLKPDNIIVEESGQPKILDFGVSRATDADVHTVTMRTNIGQLVGTIAYMSPEQALGDPSQIDPRSDIYALGVLGFELLSGQLPISVRECPIPEAARLIREEDPVRLGTINTQFRGDLDTIIQKSLEKEQDRRYQSVAAFAEDIRRFLCNEPISAHPPSRVYQFGKFARRNRGLVGGIIGMVVILIVGSVTSGIFAWRAAIQRDAARREERRVAALNQFLIHDVFGAASPQAGSAYNLRVADMLDNSTEALDKSFSDEPDIEVSIREALGRIYLLLGQFDQSEKHLQRALQIRSNYLPADSDKLVESKQELARTLWRNSKYAESSLLLDEVLAIQTKSAVYDDHDIAATMRDLGNVAYNSGDYVTAERHFRESKARYGNSASIEQLADADLAIANALNSQGKADDSIRIYRQVLSSMIGIFGEDHVEVSLVQHNLGAALSAKRQFDEARMLLNSALATRRRVFGEESVDVADTLFRLARLSLRQRKIDEAMSFGKSAYAIQQRLLHSDHSDLAESHDLLGTVNRQKRDYATAEQHFRESYRIYSATNGPASRAAAITLGSIGVCLLKQEKTEAAIDFHRKSLAATKVAFAEGDPLIHLCQVSLGNCLTKAGEFDEAESLLTESVAQLEALNHPQTNWAKKSLASLRAQATPTKTSGHAQSGENKPE